MSEHETSGMLKAVFDALPSMIFVVDEDVRIQEFNAAASDLLTVEGGGCPQATRRRRAALRAFT